MVKNNQTEPEEKASAFNEALFKMKRLHELQDTMNSMRITPWDFSKRGKFCFGVHYDCLKSLYLEISSKLTTEEKKEIKPKMDKLKKNVRSLSSKMPRVMYGSPDRSFFTSDKGKKLREKIENGILDCEELLRGYLDIHGFSTLDQETTEGDQYN